MHLKKIFPAIFFLFLFSIVSVSAQTETKKRTYNGSIRGETYTYKFNDEDFANTPAWNPETDEVPLSIRQAIVKAREHLPRFVPNADQFRVAHFFLRRVKNDRWFYQISFTCAAAGVACRDAEVRQFTILVKMDNTIIEPKKIIEQ